MTAIVDHLFGVQSQCVFAGSPLTRFYYDGDRDGTVTQGKAERRKRSKQSVTVFKPYLKRNTDVGLNRPKEYIPPEQNKSGSAFY